MRAEAERDALAEDVGEASPRSATSQTTQLAAMLDDMQAGRRPLVSGAEVRRTIEFLLSLYKSACTGEAVERGSIVPGDPFYQGMAHVLAPQGA